MGRRKIRTQWWEESTDPSPKDVPAPENPPAGRCHYCGRPIAPEDSADPRKKWCKPTCKTAFRHRKNPAYLARHRARRAQKRRERHDAQAPARILNS
jgi:hypothetical protein